MGHARSYYLEHMELKSQTNLDIEDWFRSIIMKQNCDKGER